ncbi:Npun_F0296 family exosortase-dependent surface protein [Sphingomonas sp. KC8]|uniref:Npun_F0296 family exosortase-dependent surface protein n=1 Tax=Sphingomonas sp. KC8 TaxID=1030157 RepID=UPI0002488B57|nr:PEPxxWA-CTERM sorting domain-containing protein [Sphingomonas sp. KC8]ARS26511.1 PEP-CTERM domain protein [Sphingomonas sp. KC8]
MRIGTAIAGSLAMIFGGAAAHAASFSVGIEAAGATQTTATFDYKGVETFNGLNAGVQSFSTNFGGSTVSGTYANVNVLPADQYGGAGGSNYAVAGLGIQGSYAIDFTATGTSGINYFGYWLSALDAGNTVRFFNQGTEVFSFTPTNVLALVAGNPNYYGNPLTGANSGEPYAFLNFFYDGGTFDRIVFEQKAGSTAGYESDNHTIGYFIDKGDGTPVPAVPEPATWLMLIAGFGLVGGAMRHRRPVVSFAA